MYIGIDAGTTVLKVAAFDARSGRFMAGQTRRIDTAVDADGKREQDPKAIVALLQRILRQIRAAVPASKWNGVKGIGISAQGGSTIIADRATGRNLTPMFLWNDTRAYHRIPIFTAMKPREEWSRFLLRDGPCVGLARLDWLRSRSPELLTDGHIHVGIGEFLFFHLTGAWRQDPCHALQTDCYDAARNTLTDDALALLGMSSSFHAPLRRGHETCPLTGPAAQKLGLPEGLPVAGPYMDHEAGYLSVAQAAPCPAQCSLGTAWVCNFTIPEGLHGYSATQLAIPSPLGEGYLIVQALRTGNVTWEWALREFVHPNLTKALTVQEEIFRNQLLPPAGLVFLPWLNQPNPSRDGAFGAGAFTGLSPGTTRADLVRAVAAGLAYEFRRVLDVLVQRGFTGGFVLCGGASKGRQFQQLLLRLVEPAPVYLARDADWIGARGCLHAFRTKASSCAVKRVRNESRPSSGAIRDGYQHYKTVFAQNLGGVPEGRPYEIT